MDCYQTALAKDAASCYMLCKLHETYGLFHIDTIYCRTGNFRDRKFSRFSTTLNSRAGNFREFLVRGAS